MKLRLSRSKKEDTKNVLHWSFTICDSQFMFGLFNPLVLLSRPKKLHCWINICPRTVMDFVDEQWIFYSGQILALYYDITFKEKR